MQPHGKHRWDYIQTFYTCLYNSQKRLVYQLNRWYRPIKLNYLFLRTLQYHHQKYLIHHQLFYFLPFSFSVNIIKVPERFFLIRILLGGCKTLTLRWNTTRFQLSYGDFDLRYPMDFSEPSKHTVLTESLHKQSFTTPILHKIWNSTMLRVCGSVCHTISNMLFFIYFVLNNP